MAHLMKFSRNSIGGLTRHFERYKNENGEYLKFGNQDIDISKTYLNYNLADSENQLEFIKERTSKVRCLNRDDVKIMCTWVVTLPKEIKDKEEHKGFLFPVAWEVRQSLTKHWVQILDHFRMNPV